MDVFNYFFERIAKQLEYSRNPIEKINDYLAKIAKVVFALFLIFNAIPLPCIVDVESIKLYVRFEEVLGFLSSLISLSRLFFYSVIIYGILLIIDYIYDNLAEVKNGFAQLLIGSWVVRDIFGIIYHSFLITHGLFLLLQQFHGTVNKYSFVVILYVFELCLNLLVIMYRINREQLDVIRNRNFREKNWTGYYDVNNTKVCLFDCVMFKHEEYRVHKITDDHEHKWHVIKEKSYDNNNPVSYPLSEVISEVKILKTYEKFVNGEIVKIPVADYIFNSTISIITSMTTLKAVLDYFVNEGRIIKINCIWVVTEEKISTEEETSIKELIAKYNFAKDAEILFDKNEWENYFENQVNEQVYSDMPINLSQTAVNYISVNPNMDGIKTPKIWEPAIKRILDIIMSIFALVLFSPILMISAILIKCEDSGPIFFYQQRIGINGKIIRVYKFRTMKIALDITNLENGLPDPRITKIGRFLRKTCIDELPKIFSVLKGDLSLVGPFPFRPDDLHRIENKYRLSHTMKPGITGPFVFSNWSYNLDEMIKNDQDYIQNWNLFQDIRIVFKTVYGVFRNM